MSANDLPVTILMTPGGIPASVARSQRASAEKGVSSAGLITTVQPAERTTRSRRERERESERREKIKVRDTQQQRQDRLTGQEKRQGKRQDKACSKSRSRLSSDHGVGKVPGRDQSRNPDRLSHGKKPTTY
jgi:hypothetical protein